MCRYHGNLRWVLASPPRSVLKTVSRRGTHGFFRPPWVACPPRPPLGGLAVHAADSSRAPTSPLGLALSQPWGLSYLWKPLRDRENKVGGETPPFSFQALYTTAPSGFHPSCFNNPSCSSLSVSPTPTSDIPRKEARREHKPGSPSSTLSKAWRCLSAWE